MKAHLERRKGLALSAKAEPLDGDDDVVIEESDMDKRNSQKAFATKSQTVIVFDWDDTLFPSTFIRKDMHLSSRMSMEAQDIPKQKQNHIRAALAKIHGRVERVLRVANAMGKVVLVTLARKPWVTDSCTLFCPAMMNLLEEFNFDIVYAQEGNDVDYRRLKLMSDEDVGFFWSRLKGEAIGRVVQDFYSQYDGQTWKNIISIGDSDFERVGTMQATGEYLSSHGIPACPSSTFTRMSNHRIPNRKSLGEAEIGGHLYRVRTKTFKMLGQPAISELLVQLALLAEWLPPMVRLDDGFDIEFGNMTDEETIRSIEETLQAGQRGPALAAKGVTANATSKCGGSPVARNSRTDSGLSKSDSKSSFGSSSDSPSSAASSASPR